MPLLGSPPTVGVDSLFGPIFKSAEIDYIPIVSFPCGTAEEDTTLLRR
jgi:hypothetical protein